jgi:PPM family protein phosphatase
LSELFDIASRTHPGAVRAENEDHCATFRDEQCAGLLVADGVSSLNGGATASRMAVETTLRVFRAEQASVPPDKRLLRAAQRANLAVHDAAMTTAGLHGMATTLTAVVLTGSALFASHIGDCRLYLLRAGSFRQLSRDHTVSAERVRLGVLSETRAKHHPARSTLTRCLGRELIARFDRINEKVMQHDVLMICSDGIHGLLSDSEMAELCVAPSANAVCEGLIEAANSRGSPDNVTAAVARITGTPLPGRVEGSGFIRVLSRAFGRG